MQNVSVASASTTNTLPLSLLIKGKNPRTHFDAVEMEELTSSIKAQGVLQPILVRPKGEKFEIVAGERRYRAALAAFGESYEIPVHLRELSDAEADAAALTENFDRSDMSPTEEAVAAAKLVGRVNGDRDEAARILGWSRATLDKRLALMNCAEPVRKALNERSILLGHAELLAALSRDVQEKMLPVILKEKKTIAELKATIEKAAAKLTDAIFDKAGCADCQHNSSLQTSMFAESVTDGSCTKPSCFNEKTEGALKQIAEGLKDEFPVIRIIRIGDNATLTKLEASGDKGVGEEQAKACTTCADYGAAVSALPQAMGKVFKGQCFNTGCNSKKIAARIKAEQEALQAPLQKEVSNLTGAPQAVSGKGTSATPDKSAIPEEKKEAVSVSESERVKAYRVAVWRKALKKEIAQNPALSMQYLVALCLNGNANCIESGKLRQAFKKLSGLDSHVTDLGENAGLVAQASDEIRSNMMTLLAASAMDGLEVHRLQQLARHHQLDLTKHWALDKEFLDLLTKSEIEFLATEIGLNKAITTGFKKLFTEKKPDLIDKLLKVKGFNYSAVIPKVLQY